MSSVQATFPISGAPSQVDKPSLPTSVQAQKVAAPRTLGFAYWKRGGWAAVAWLGLAALTAFWPNKEIGFSDWAYTREFAIAAAGVAVLLLAISLAGERLGRFFQWIKPAGPWLVAGAALLAIWQVLTAKTGVLPPPFFAPPQSLLEVYIDDASRLGLSVAHSLRLLVNGIVIGAVVGFVTGVWVGWSRIAIPESRWWPQGSRRTRAKRRWSSPG